ncbi:MAG: hypothetical protein V4689_22450 [Verrucomicrobiota bacterium]
MTRNKIARGCEVRVAEIGEDGAFFVQPFSTTSRNISVTERIPGWLYAYQSRTVGGSTTYSDRSDQLVQCDAKIGGLTKRGGSPPAAHFRGGPRYLRPCGMRFTGGPPR